LVYLKNGQIQLAKEQLTEALKLDPDFSGSDEAKKTVGAIKERR